MKSNSTSVDEDSLSDNVEDEDIVSDTDDDKQDGASNDDGGCFDVFIMLAFLGFVVFLVCASYPQFWTLLQSIVDKF